MPKVFVSYRREDSAYPAHRIYQELTNHFGVESVVFDVDTIPLGVDFRRHLQDQVSTCDILLAVIGDRWLETLNQRLDDPRDYVRIEIQAALQRGIPVIPVLVGNASVPGEGHLPAELADLAYRNAAEVRAGGDLANHVKRLVGGVERLLADQVQRAGEERLKAEAESKRPAGKDGSRRLQKDGRQRARQEVQRAAELDQRKEAEEAKRKAQQEIEQAQAER